MILICLGGRAFSSSSSSSAALFGPLLSVSSGSVVGEQAAGAGSVSWKGSVMSGRFDSDECLDGPAGCVGEVDKYLALSGSGERYPRCEGHQAAYVERMQPQIDAINRRYPAMAPPDFDPTYCGEVWSEEDY